MTLLNVAFQVYRGCRLLSAENRISPGAYAGQGILAGCPIAPALSKLALFDCCQRAHASQYTGTISVWLDDISGDVESKRPRETAARIYRFYTLLKAELGSTELLMSKEKSAFVCSDGETTKALRALLKPEDPKIVSVVKDLGVDAAGAARRRVDQQTQRIQKASKTSNRLRRLKVQRKPVLTRICNVSILTTGTWGHQAQGLAPSKMRVLRGIATGPVRLPMAAVRLCLTCKTQESRTLLVKWSRNTGRLSPSAFSGTSPKPRGSKKHGSTLGGTSPRPSIRGEGAPVLWAQWFVT